MIPRFTVFDLAAQPIMPWANGGGSTRQVAIDPPDGSLARGFRWRVSIAQVGSDGPFSHLPGVDRSLWLLGGAGVRLDVDGRSVALDRPLQRFDFAGETPIACRLLAGPCEDLNVMWARSQVAATAAVTQLQAYQSHPLPPAAERLVCVLQGEVRVDGAPRVVQAREALRIDGGAALAITAVGPAQVLVCSFRPRS